MDKHEVEVGDTCPCIVIEPSLSFFLLKNGRRSVCSLHLEESPTIGTHSIDLRTETPAKPIERERIRRKLDLNANSRGAFGQLLGTLSKAKKEDKLRSASEAVRVPCSALRPERPAYEHSECCRIYS